MDVGGGLVVSDASTGLAVDLRVRMLVMHQAEGFRERGMAVSLSYDPTPSTPLGLVARVAPSWGGQATSGAEALWGRQTMGGMAPGGIASGNRLDGEVGYGLPVGSRFVGTPRVGFGTSEYGRDLPGRLRPRAAEPGKPEPRSGHRRAAPREPAAGGREQRSSRPGHVGLVDRGRRERGGPRGPSTPVRAAPQWLVAPQAWPKRSRGHTLGRRSETSGEAELREEAEQPGRARTPALGGAGVHALAPPPDEHPGDQAGPGTDVAVERPSPGGRDVRAAEASTGASAVRSGSMDVLAIPRTRENGWKVSEAG